MTRRILDNIDQNREEWLRLKKNKVSSSNIATIMGLSKHCSPLELWAEWTGKKQNTFNGNAATKLGLLLEPFVAELYEKRTGLKVVRANALYANDDYPWAVCSPDYFTKRDGVDTVLEIKTGNRFQLARWENGKVPEEYLVQLQFQLGIMGWKQGTLSGFLGLDLDEDFDRDFDFDAELFVMMVERAEEFVDLVQRDVPPNAGPGDAEIIQTIAKRAPVGLQFAGAQAEMVEGFLVALRQIKEEATPLKDKVDALDEEKKRIENSLKLLLKDHHQGVLPDGRMLKVTTIDVKERIQKAYSYDRLFLPKDTK